MNQRLQDLLMQARPGMSIVGGGTGYATKDFDNGRYILSPETIEKFSELIVQDCINCCDEVDRINRAYIEEYHIDPQNGPKECIQVIKAHFGVEE